MLFGIQPSNAQECGSLTEDQAAKISETNPQFCYYEDWRHWEKKCQDDPGLLSNRLSCKINYVEELSIERQLFVLGTVLWALDFENNYRTESYFENGPKGCFGHISVENTEERWRNVFRLDLKSIEEIGFFPRVSNGGWLVIGNSASSSSKGWRVTGEKASIGVNFEPDENGYYGWDKFEPLEFFEAQELRDRTFMVPTFGEDQEAFNFKEYLFSNVLEWCQS